MCKIPNHEAHYELIDALITLDHRRVPLPRSTELNVLSIRGTDFPADKGVLPSEDEQSSFNICVKEIPEASHNDMSDYGPSELKEKIGSLVSNYLLMLRSSTALLINPRSPG